MELHIPLKVGDLEQRTVEVHLDLLGCGASYIVRSLHHQADNVIVKPCHAKLREIRPECDLCVVLAVVVRDFGLVLHSHVVLEGLAKLLLDRFVSRFHNELLGENICQLRPISIATTSDFLLVVVVVVAREQMPKDQFRHIALVFLVHLDGDAFSIVENRDAPGFFVDIDLNPVHTFLVAHGVVRSVYEDLIKDLVQSRHVVYLAIDNLTFLLIEDIKVLVLMFARSNVGVGPQKDVLQLRLFLINLLDGFAPSELLRLVHIAVRRNVLLGWHERCPPQQAWSLSSSGLARLLDNWYVKLDQS
mmetsp:Transcript_21056/g.48767  ORF Transcript_21056/g.48767 Transcript_21056/m.48767 type:complete len:303 (+) Transcript_21056:3478-4386(+)